MVGPSAMFDLMVIMPCTGNTIAKLANGITDSPVLMAAKAHLRNERPLVLCMASNDALGMNMKNIWQYILAGIVVAIGGMFVSDLAGNFFNAKNIYFVPFSQDDPTKKPNSLVAHFGKMTETIKFALDGKQIQPVLAM